MIAFVKAGDSDMDDGVVTGDAAQGVRLKAERDRLNLSQEQMAAADVYLVFADDGLRPIDDQRVLLAGKIERVIKKKKEKPYRVVRTATIENGKLLVGGVAMDAAKVAALLKEAGY